MSVSRFLLLPVVRTRFNRRVLEARQLASLITAMATAEEHRVRIRLLPRESLSLDAAITRQART